MPNTKKWSEIRATRSKAGASPAAIDREASGNISIMTQDDQRQAVEREAHPGTTNWPDGSRTDADTTTGDLTTETGEQLYRETDQHGEPLEEARPKP